MLRAGDFTKNHSIRKLAISPFWCSALIRFIYLLNSSDHLFICCILDKIYSNPCYCTTACSTGEYGLHCKQRCSAFCNSSGICHPLTGECIDGCIEGWEGAQCLKRKFAFSVILYYYPKNWTILIYYIKIQLNTFNHSQSVKIKRTCWINLLLVLWLCFQLRRKQLLEEVMPQIKQI